jgi:hypothetical protein
MPFFVHFGGLAHTVFKEGGAVLATQDAGTCVARGEREQIRRMNLCNDPWLEATAQLRVGDWQAIASLRYFLGIS